MKPEVSAGCLHGSRTTLLIGCWLVRLPRRLLAQVDPVPDCLLNQHSAWRAFC